MAVFENLGPELTDEHKGNRRQGIEFQRQALETLVVKFGGVISTAIRSEMASTGCTYETACLRFVQECDRFTANMHYIDLGIESEAFALANEKSD